MIVMDTETTGLDPNKHDIIQIAVLALSYDFTPDKNIPPFYMLIKPAHYREGPEYKKEIEPAMNVNKISLDRLMADGFHPHKASELFEEFWKMLGSQPLEPICQNYPFDSGFLKAWLGPISYSHYFSRYYRDTYCAARYIKDRASYMGEKDPFSEGLGLTKLANALKIEHQGRAHDALSDCVTTAEVYKRLCTYAGEPKRVYPTA